jgi:DNA-binding MarR family transcriptional regulator
MSDLTLRAVLRLIAVSSSLEARLGPSLGSVHGISLGEYLLLRHLSGAPLGRLRRVDLAAALHVSQSSVTRMTEPMEKIGLVRREADPRDARVAYVVLTEAGIERLRDAEDTLGQASERIFDDRWTPEEIESLSALLGRLAHSLPGHLG